MKRITLVLLVVITVGLSGLSGCAPSLLGKNGLREINQNEYVNNPNERPASMLILYNIWSCSHAWVYLFRGDLRDEEMYANVNGVPKVFEGKYLKKIYLTNCVNKDFPVKKELGLDVDTAYTLLIVVEQGAFGKIIAFPRYVISTNRGMFTALYVDPLGFRSKWANNVISVPGTDTPAYVGPFPGTFTITPSQILFGR